MNENSLRHFITGKDLSDFIEAQTSVSSDRFERRDFVEPLIKFCLDGNYTARLGIVYGLRSTGKTVGMLQTAESLMKDGYKAAYARFSYEKTGMSVVNAEIVSLAKEGYTHFFLDEASYLGGFVNESAEWADLLVPLYRIKMIISGTDSFMLWTAQTTSLFHRYELFPVNWNSFPEYKRVMKKSYDDYKKDGGIFTDEDMPAFIQAAVVDNLLHTIEHCMEDADRRTLYTDALYGLNPVACYKAVISILKCAAEDAINEHFAEKSGQKNIVALGVALTGFFPHEKRDIKKRVAESIDLYRNFTPVKDPLGVIEALVAFLVRIGCLYEYSTAEHEYGDKKSYTFTHNALMSFAIEETIQGILKLKEIDRAVFASSIRQAAEGALNESIVFAHVFHGANVKGGDKVFKYQDADNREIDIAVINREAKRLRLLEVKSKTKIDIGRVINNEAKYLFDDKVLKNIGVDNSFTITRAIVYRGKTEFVARPDAALLLVNIEDLLIHYMDLWRYLNHISNQSKILRSRKHPKSVLGRLHENQERLRRKCVSSESRKSHDPEL